MTDRREAFERLWREEYAQVLRTGYLITGDREEAADVAQEAFARAYERWRTVSRLDRPGAWVQRVAANLAISWRRRERARRRTVLAAHREAAPGPDPPDPELVDALLSLAPAQRAAVVLRYYADQSVEDTASALGKQPGTIRALTSQGLGRLREQLSRTDVDDDVRS